MPDLYTFCVQIRRGSRAARWNAPAARRLRRETTARDEASRLRLHA